MQTRSVTAAPQGSSANKGRWFDGGAWQKPAENDRHNHRKFMKMATKIVPNPLKIELVGEKCARNGPRPFWNGFSRKGPGPFWWPRGTFGGIWAEKGGFGGAQGPLWAVRVVKNRPFSKDFKRK